MAIDVSISDVNLSCNFALVHSRKSRTGSPFPLLASKIEPLLPLSPVLV
jgi:hypothetical protein